MVRCASVRACEHVHHSPNLFAAPQCLGYRNERGVTTPEMCLPSKDSVIRQLKRTLRYVKDVKSLFVASDSNHMIPDLREALKRMVPAITLALAYMDDLTEVRENTAFTREEGRQPLGWTDGFSLKTGHATPPPTKTAVPLADFEHEVPATHQQHLQDQYASVFHTDVTEHTMITTHEDPVYSKP
ncbi:hypothetical protein PR048_004699 [Dryococelus australis]|uniref:GDP-fucose protein O-fucosyltransferase 1 n=1 Tax=Dryococelus australis TaxID=614101 RepID=A0ABQ9I784_9NEOP|nr:hypothetical protein PR048_004699 [Dryococelus australis]